TYLAIGLAYQEGLELAPRAAGYEAVQQVGLARLQQFFHLFARDFLLQDHLAGTEVARPLRSDSLLADVAHAMLENAGLAFRAGAERGMAAEVHRLGVTFVSLPEIELELVVVGDAQDGRKGPAHLADEAVERADGAFAQQLFHFGKLEGAASG